VLSQVPESTEAEMEAAVAAAAAAFPEWRDTSVSARARVMFKLQQLIREHTDELADVITLELGKVWASGHLCTAVPAVPTVIGSMSAQRLRRCTSPRCVSMSR
jgi:acyl-CoA reductase-like NAD-dependent aldehyde dehydrogenase